MSDISKKEFRIKINTEEGLEEFETGFIVGKLNAVIINSFEEVSVTIESKIGYLIFHNQSHKGINYYAPRAILQGQKLIHFDVDQFDKFKLDETLIIRVSGPKNADVSITLRLD